MAKNIKKIIPFVMFATLLSSCSNELTLKDGEDKTIVKENASYEDLDLTTYQEVFDDLFTASGAVVASQELIYRIAKQIVENIDSEDEKTQKLEKSSKTQKTDKTEFSEIKKFLSTKIFL